MTAVCQNPSMRLPIREHLVGTSGFSAGVAPSGFVRLHANENPLGPSPLALKAIAAAVASCHHYGDPQGEDLRTALSEVLQLPQESIVLGNGSDEIIHYLSLAVLEEGSSIVVGDPSFIRYEAGAHLQNATVRKVPLDNHDRHDLEAMADAVDQTTRLVFIANPNNPTGTLVFRKELDRFLCRVPEPTIVVLDEAYYEYVEHSEYPDAAEYVSRGHRVVGLRTFSKTHGLAGLRIGYGVMPPQLAHVINAIRQPFNTNNLARVAGVAALRDEEHLRKTRDLNRHSLDRIKRIVESYGGRTTQSYANFVWVDFGRPAAPICKALFEKGVLVRSGEMFGKPNHMRISSGTKEDMDRLEEAFRATCEALAS